MNQSIKVFEKIANLISPSTKHENFNQIAFGEGNMANSGSNKTRKRFAKQKISRKTVKKEVAIARKRKKQKNPVDSLKGMLKHVKKSSVELQHDASKIWVEKALSYKK